MLFINIFLIIIYLVLNVNCQIISLTPDTDIQLIGSSDNKYIGYPTESNGNSCSFVSNLIITDKISNRESALYGLNSNFSYVSSVSNYYVNIVQNVQIQNNVDSIQSFSIDLFYNNDIETKASFIIQYTCKVINTSNIQVDLINSKAYYDINGYQATFVTVNGLDGYFITSLTLSEPGYQSRRITDNLYLVYLKSFQEFPTSSIEFGVKFPDKTFNFTILPSYSIDSYQDIQYELFPDTIVSQPFQENGFYNSPMMSIKSNLTFDKAYTLCKSSIAIFLPRKVSASADGLSFNYILPFSFITNSYSFYYNNGPSITSDIVIPLTIIKYTNSILPTGNLLVGSNTFTFEMDSSTLADFSFKYNVFVHEYINQKIFSTSFPFGFKEGSLIAFNYKVDYILKPKINNFKIYEAPGGNGDESYNVAGPNVVDYYLPRLQNFKFEYITKFKYLLTIQVSDDSGILYIKSGLDSAIYGCESLVEGSKFNGTFEIVIDTFRGVYLNIFDDYSNTLSILQGSYAYSDQNKIPIFFKTPPILDFDNFMVNDISFLENNINITNQENYNILYFNTTVPFDSDRPIQLILYDDISYGIDQGELTSFSVYWDDILKRYYVPFIVPKNSNPNEISYSLSFSIFSQLSGYLFKLPLNVSSTNFDNDGPMITSIENSLVSGQLGWKFIIEDSQNGFNRGYVKAMGSVDGSTFKFNFTINDAISPTSPTDPLEFNLILNITTPCITQSYQIVHIHLLDSNARESQFILYGSTNLGHKNPLRYLLDKPELLVIESVCQASTLDTSAPFLKSFIFSKSIVDLGSLDRKVSFNFTTEDLESGIMPTQNPIVYLQSSNFKLLECESYITFIDTEYHTANYYCEIDIPVSFGPPNSQIQVSVYSFINNGGKFRGYASSDLETSGFTSSISVQFTLDQPIILDYEKYLCSNELIIYGRILKDITNAEIQLSEGQTIDNISIKRIIGSSVIKLELDSIFEPFKIRLSTNNNIYSNWFSIIPTYYKANFPISSSSSSSNSNSTLEPLPTNKPQQCLGNPVCGGPDKGYCSENQGCVCYSPWIGNDCLSQVIIVPPPIINTTEPTVEIPINGNNNSSSGDNIFYKSLISLVSIREIDIYDKIVYKYTFDKWIYTELDPSTNKYQINITIGNNQVTITSILKWFENETNIIFANQSLIMNPSSIKYTIQVENYPFQSKLNSLELVMFASFESNKIKDICSSKEFGETSTGDNSNYLKIQVQDKSLYGRFIKRGVIDDTNIAINNKLLDSYMNKIITQNSNQVQTYIGISIPSFEFKATIDPDFSVILNYNSASSSSINSVCSNKSGLSGAKIAGIVVGSFAFAFILVVGGVYFIYKRKKDNQFVKNMNSKLKSLN